MANIKSAKKRIEVNAKKNELNRSAKSEINTVVKKFKTALTAKEFVLADELYKNLTALFDKGAGNSVLHKNKADRNKARYAKMLHDAKNSK